MFLILLLPLLAAARRLSMSECSHEAYVLASGAPLLKGRVFPAPRTFVDYRVDDTGEGTALVARMPGCLRPGAMSLKVTNTQGVADAIAWLEERCRTRDCVVYTLHDLPPSLSH